MSDRKVKLNIMGISYSPLRSGAFALLLAQEGGPYRIPIVIGAAEAQSIAIKIEGIVTPRPITHDLFTSLSHAFGIELTEVFIYKFEDGIFSSELTFSDGIKEIKLDSRTSDAIAIAIRTGAPIYTTESIMLQTGSVFDGQTDEDSSDDTDSTTNSSTKNYESMSDEQLKDCLAEMIENENYEEASLISEIIKSRNNHDND